MVRPTQSKTDFERARAETLDAAIQLFKDGGEAAVSFRNLAKQLGYSVMKPYRYFPGGKDELLAMIKAQSLNDFAAWQSKTLEEYEGDPNLFLEAFVEAYVTFALDDPTRFRIMFEQNSNPDRFPELQFAIDNARAVVLDGMMRVNELGISSGDPVKDAQLFWVSIHGLLTLHFSGQLAVGKSLEEFLPFLIHALKQALAHI